MPSARRPPGRVPLQRALSKLGFASRTEAQRIIAAGEVEVDGCVCRDPQRWVRPESASIRHRGRAVVRAPFRAILLHKPRGVVTTRSDERGRPTVYDLLPEELRALHPVGRLDQASTGLLILTNDTRLSAWLTDPANAVQRVYVVTVRGLVEPAAAERMMAGLADDGEFLKADRVVVRKASRRESHLVVTLAEGRNREIRRLCRACGHEVTRLKRVQFGGLALAELEPGLFRELSPEDLARAFQGLPEAVRR
jgi:23S rRNA pseudouridine2605 synthase